MMMALLLAIASPASAVPTLPAATYDAALLCRSAAMASGDPEHPTLDQIGQGAFFAFVAVHERNDGRLFADRAAEILVPQTLVAMSKSIAAKLMARCYNRFPIARRTSADLPADPLDRDFTCWSSAGVVAGMATARDADIGSSDGPRLIDVMNRFRQLLTPERFKAGNRLFDKAANSAALERTVSYGTLPVVVQACEKQIVG